MKIVCCANMPYAREAFSTLGDCLVKDGRAIEPADVKDADLLAIRSTTKVNRQLLEGSRVRFVGTATIGIDHMDTAWMDQAGIRWCSAAGCNANSVSEYFTAALLCLANRHGFTLKGKTVGVVGVGNVGRRVVEKATALGLRVLKNDPPRARQEAGGPETFVSLDQVLAESDILTLHVPLTKDGPDRTHHMADREFFRKLKRDCLYFNCARGPVNETGALLAALDSGTVSHAVMDTWEGEPLFRTDLMDKADIATPHIAGHSFEGKVMGTVMVYREACRFLGVEPTWTVDALLPPPLVPRIELDATGMTDEKILWEIVRRVYDIESDDRRLRDGAVPDDKARAAHFDLLRKKYPVRREFRFTQLHLRNAPPHIAGVLHKLGFDVG